MSDGVVNSITRLISSPPGELVAGTVLFGIIYKFFERVESVLNEDTKLEIAVWLLGVRTAGKTQTWPDTFARIFDRVFGTKQLSWTCLWRSSLVSCAVGMIATGFTLHAWQRLSAATRDWRTLLLLIVIANVLPGYLSLLKTRYFLHMMSKRSSTIAWIVILLVDLAITVLIGLAAINFGEYALELGWAVKTGRSLSLDDIVWGVLTQLLPRAFSPRMLVDAQLRHVYLLIPAWFYPAFFTSVWLWLYAGSGFILRAARRFDLGFTWFNRHFETRRKPLQSIGFVSGVLVACAYWLSVGVDSFVR